MPTYLNPRKVTVDTGGGGGVIAAAVTAGLAWAAVSAVMVVLADVVTAILVAMGVLVAVLVPVLVWHVRRNTPVFCRCPLTGTLNCPVHASVAVEAAQQRAIEQARVVPGTVLSSRLEQRR